MTEETRTPVTIFWVTRNRRADLAIPFPEGWDEYVSFDIDQRAKPTGRIKIARFGKFLLATLDELTALDNGHQFVVNETEKGFEITGDPIALPDEGEIRHSGLRRNLTEETRLRDYIGKFESGGSLSDKELRFLIQFYGIIIRTTEVAGLSYYLATADAKAKHDRLLGIARERGWTQALISMYGAMVEGVLERIA